MHIPLERLRTCHAMHIPRERLRPCQAFSQFSENSRLPPGRQQTVCGGVASSGKWFPEAGNRFPADATSSLQIAG